MKKNLLALFSMILTVLLLVSCSSNTTQDESETSETYISGEVLEVQYGKDGYTARMSTEDNHIYFATISIPNLKENAEQFREVEVGETITVKGDIWEMNDETHITVRELK